MLAKSFRRMDGIQYLLPDHLAAVGEWSMVLLTSEQRIQLNQFLHFLDSWFMTAEQ